MTVILVAEKQHITGHCPLSMEGGGGGGGGNYHRAREIGSNPYLKSIIDKLLSLFPDVPESLNSFLVTKYDSHTAHIPPHSDNEPSIDPNSSILTITLRASRPVVFRRKLPSKY